MAFKPHRAAKHVALPLAACAVAALSAFAALPASAQVLQAQRIVIDKDTGRARAPEHDELAAAAAVAPAARSAARSSASPDSSVKSALASHPALQKLDAAKPVKGLFGAQGRHVGLDRLAFTVVRREADGRVTNQCVTGDEAADKARHGALVGGDHDH